MKEFNHNKFWLIGEISMYVGIIVYLLYILISNWSHETLMITLIFLGAVMAWFFGTLTWRKNIRIDNNYLILTPLSYYILRWPAEEKILLKDIKSISQEWFTHASILYIITKKSYPKTAYLAGVLGIYDDFLEYLKDKVPKDCSIYNSSFFKQNRIK